MNEKIKILAIKQKMPLQLIAQKSNQSQSNLANKLIRNDFKTSELERIANACGVGLEINFILPDGTKI